MSKVAFLVIMLSVVLAVPAARAEGSMEGGTYSSSGSYTYACVNWSTCEDVVETKIPNLNNARWCATVSYAASCKCTDSSNPTTEGYCFLIW